MDVNDPLVLVFSRNAFYKRLHYLALGAFFLSLFVIVFLIIMLVYLSRNPTHPIYFATDDVGRLIRIVPVDTPNMSTEDVTEWTIEAVQASYSYDYINFRAQLQDAQKYFTNYGWGKYMQALTASNNLLALTTRKQVIIAQVVGQPKVLAAGLLGGSYAWKFQMPLLVTYTEPPYDRPKFQNALDIVVTIQRQPPLQGYKGLGVLQLVASFASSSEQAPEISTTSTG